MAVGQYSLAALQYVMYRVGQKTGLFQKFVTSVYVDIE